MECPLCSRELKKISPSHLKFTHGITMSEFKMRFPTFKTGISRYGKDNPFYGKKHTVENKKKFKEKCGTRARWEKIHGKDVADKMMIDYSNTMSLAVSGEKNPFFGKFHTDTAKQLMSDKKTKLISAGLFVPNNNSFGTKGYYFSIKNNENNYFDSLLEKYRMIQLDEDETVITWTKKHGIRISYEFENSIKKYVPDFLITTSSSVILEEIKGYDVRGECKKAALREYCNSNNIEFSWKTQDQFTQYRKWLKMQKKF